jgi:hypothetical protein
MKTNKWKTLFTRIFVFILLPAGLTAEVNALDYLGASAVLKQVEARNAQPGLKQKSSELSKLHDDLKSFAASITNLPPDDAAKQWLALVDRAAKVRQQNRMNYTPDEQPIDAKELLAVLPPPSDWSALSNAIAARPPAGNGQELRELGLHFLADTLTGNSEGQKVKSLDSRPKRMTQIFKPLISIIIFFSNGIAPCWRLQTNRAPF